MGIITQGTYEKVGAIIDKLPDPTDQIKLMLVISRLDSEILLTKWFPEFCKRHSNIRIGESDPDGKPYEDILKGFWEE